MPDTVDLEPNMSTPCADEQALDSRIAAHQAEIMLTQNVLISHMERSVDLTCSALDTIAREVHSDIKDIASCRTPVEATTAHQLWKVSMLSQASLIAVDLITATQEHSVEQIHGDSGNESVISAINLLYSMFCHEAAKAIRDRLAYINLLNEMQKGLLRRRQQLST